MLMCWFNRFGDGEIHHVRGTIGTDCNMEGYKNIVIIN